MAVLTRLNVKSAVRREELVDMIDEHQPAMNLGDAKTPDEAAHERRAP